MSKIRVLDDDDRVLMGRTSEAAADLIKWWHPRTASMSAGHRAAGALFVHVANCWTCIRKLLDNCADPHDLEVFSAGAAIILRSLHDACLQLEYILHGDPTLKLSSDDLGQRYLEFETVERFKAANRVDEFDSKLAKHLAASPKRAAGEAALKAEYDRVKGNYPHKTHWYTGNLADVAARISCQEEYFWLLSQYNSVVHGGPSAVFHGPIPAGADLYLVAMNLLCRAGLRIRDTIGAELNASTNEVLESESDLLNIGPASGSAAAESNADKEF